MRLLGFVEMKMARVDPSFATEEQKQKWLPPMARLEKIGCIGLTEPLVGSGMWIGNAPWRLGEPGLRRLCGTFRGARFDVATLAPAA